MNSLVTDISRLAVSTGRIAGTTPTASQSTSTPPDLHQRRQTAKREIRGILDHLPRGTIFALLGGFHDAPFDLWRYGPCLGAALSLVQDIYREWTLAGECDQRCILAPASCDADGHELTGASRDHAAECFKRLANIQGLDLAIAWHVPGDPECRLVCHGYAVDEAFEGYARRMVESIEDGLGPM